MTDDVTNGLGLLFILLYGWLREWAYLSGQVRPILPTREGYSILKEYLFG